MILIDTSVWIRKWAGQPNFAAGLDGLLRQDQVGGHALVHGELLAGDTGGRAQALRDYEQLPWAPTLPHQDVVGIVRQRKLAGRGVGWIDLHLLAASLASGWAFWTADEHLASLAREMRIAWTIGL